MMEKELLNHMVAVVEDLERGLPEASIDANKAYGMVCSAATAYKMMRLFKGDKDVDDLINRLVLVISLFVEFQALKEDVQ